MTALHNRHFSITKMMLFDTVERRYIVAWLFLLILFLFISHALLDKQRLAAAGNVSSQQCRFARPAVLVFGSSMVEILNYAVKK